MEKKPAMLEIKRKQEKLSSEVADLNQYDLLVFCHLRWNFVYQRPQHLISRLSTSMKTLFVEEPIPFGPGEEGSFELDPVSPQLHVLRPRTSSITGIVDILKKLLPTNRIEVGWFYSPAFSEVLSEFHFDKLVYDCMDELSLFRGAPPQLVEQERFLLSEVDIVFTGGKSLYEAKRKHHDRVYCFPSSVERSHFSEASKSAELPKDIRSINAPVIGYFGVIDERIDLQLLQQVAVLNPDKNFVMLGPLAKISEQDLPREKNLHYLGFKAYSELPKYIAAFDIAMMPFALNDATRFISPTKTLEYMAAGKPIISTPIKDVERDYKHCLAIVRTPEEFSAAIEELLKKLPTEYLADYETILDRTSWDSTAERMKQIITTKTNA